MPVVIVEMWEGRNVESKNKIIEGITKVFTDGGTPADAVTVILKETPKSMWGKAGKPASEA